MLLPKEFALPFKIKLGFEPGEGFTKTITESSAWQLFAELNCT